MLLSFRYEEREAEELVKKIDRLDVEQNRNKDGKDENNQNTEEEENKDSEEAQINGDKGTTAF